MIARMLAVAALACLPASAHMGPHPETGIAFDQHLGAHEKNDAPRHA